MRISDARTQRRANLMRRREQIIRNMKAIRVEQFDGPEVMKLAELPQPEPGAFGKIVLVP